MNCRRCGASIIPHAKSCPKCGLENPGVYWQSAAGEPVRVNNQPAPQPASEPKPQTQTPPQAQQAPTPQPASQAQSSSAVATKKKSSPLKTVFILAVIVILGIFIYNFITNHGLKGTWIADENSRYSITFSDRKNGYISDGNDTVNFTYTVEGKKVTIITEETLFRNSDIETLKFKVGWKKLTLTDESGDVETFHK